jgi:Skp family chaperone for outer membrane proteins
MRDMKIWSGLRRVVATAVALGVLVPGALQAQAKIGVVDMSKVFDGYYRREQADTQLKDRAADFEKARQGMVSDFETAKTEFERLRESATDLSLSVEERENRKAAAEKKLLDIRQIEQDVAQFDRTSRSTLTEQRRRMMERIVEEIKEVVAEKGKAGAYDLVLDVKAVSMAEVPIVLYHNGSNDLTREVLAELNSRRPVDLPGAAAPGGVSQ